MIQNTDALIQFKQHKIHAKLTKVKNDATHTHRGPKYAHANTQYLDASSAGLKITNKQQHHDVVDLKATYFESLIHS